LAEKKEEFNAKSQECKRDMLFILKELYIRKKISEEEYYRAIELVRRGDY